MDTNQAWTMINKWYVWKRVKHTDRWEKVSDSFTSKEDAETCIKVLLIEVPENEYRALYERKRV